MIAAGPRGSPEPARVLFEESDIVPDTLSLLDKASGRLRDAGAALRSVLKDREKPLGYKMQQVTEQLGLTFQERSLDDLPPDQFSQREYPRHAGYSASTRLVYGRLAVPMLLDSGASCCAQPEEVALMIIADAVQAIREGVMTMESEEYPIVTMYRYTAAAARPLTGVASNANLTTVYAIVMRTMFVPEGEDFGPWKDIYYKILPAGASNLMHCGIIGFPVLDKTPYGLGHRVAETTHVFEALSVSLPRTELSARARYFELLQKARATGQEAMGTPLLKGQLPEVVGFLGEDACFALAAVRRIGPISPANAFVDVDTVTLSPGDQAVVPIRWDKAVPNQDFMSVPVEPELCALEALTGVCPGGQQAISMCVENTGVMDVTLDRGAMIACVAERSLPLADGERGMATDDVSVLGSGRDAESGRVPAQGADSDATGDPLRQRPSLLPEVPGQLE